MANNMQYKFKKSLAALNPKLKNLDPQVLGEEVARIRTLGQFKTEALVDAAKDADGNWDKDAPLYGVFEHNETAAARKWNIQQASHLLGCLIQVEISGDTAGVEMPLVVSVHTEQGPRYEDFRTVLKTDALRNRFLDNFQKEIEVLQDRLQVYQKVAEVLNPYVDKLKEAILECRDKVAV